MRGIDSIVRTLLGSSLPWFVATAILLGWEIQSLSQRGWSAAVPSRPTPRLHREHVLSDSRFAMKRVSLVETLRSQREAIIVVGCLSTDQEGEVEVTLSMEPSASRKPSELAATIGPLEMDAVKDETFSEFVRAGQASLRCPVIPAVTRPNFVATCRETPPRFFFLQSPRGSAGDPHRHVAISCQLAGESRLIRVYVEQSNVERMSLEPLIAELLQLADDVIGPRIAELVGPVCDRDADGKLAVVLSHQLNQPGGMWAEVEGVTQASDFRSEVPRPQGNQSDVIFLSTRLAPGERLRAILAHEWGHAAIFSRRYCADSNDCEPIPTEDDWLNEALTHLIEVQAAGTSSNVTHRQRAFLARTAAAPLIVRDYARPEFWRHHGCRGAAMSFLDWCHQHNGPQLITHLIADRGVGVEHLECATGESFDRLFQGWTTSLGKTLAQHAATRHEAGCQASEVAQDDPSHCPKFREWHPAGDASHRTITLRLRATTAEYVKLRLDDSTTESDLLATSPNGCRLQLTLIPVGGMPPNRRESNQH